MKLQDLSPQTLKATDDRVLMWQIDLAKKGKDFGWYKLGQRFLTGDNLPYSLTDALDCFVQAKSLGCPDSHREIDKVIKLMCADIGKRVIEPELP